MFYKKKQQKYKNEFETVGGIKFHSKAEANRYTVLTLLESTGRIKNLVLQPRFDYIEKNKLIFYYKADFKYFDMRENRTVIEDVKGVETPVFVLKKKLIESRYGIEIELIK